MKNLFPLILIMIVAWSSLAEARRNKTSLSYACLNIDGVPIAHDTEAATNCCLNGALLDPPPESCRAGFISIQANAVADGMAAFEFSQNVLQNAAAMTGVGGDFGSTGGSTGGSSDSTGVVEQGILAGGQGAGPLGPLGKVRAIDSKGGVGAPSAPGGGGFGGAGMGMGAGAGAMSMGLSGADQANQKKGSGGVDDGNVAMGAYAGRGAGERAYLASNGPSQVISGDSPVDVANYGAQGGDPAGAASAQAGGEGEDLLTGSPEDAADYLNRIDRNVSIFAVVSKRYEREVSRSRVRAVEIK